MVDLVENLCNDAGEVEVEVGAVDCDATVEAASDERDDVGDDDVDVRVGDGG